MAEGKIIGLVKTEGKERVYQMDDGSVQSYKDGSASWRHNNPGNLKFEYAHSADTTVHTSRSKEKALSDAQHRYQGIVDLDQWGNAVFETYEAGRAAKIQLLEKQHGDRTVPEMLRKYSKPDYTGATHWDAQEASIYKTADAQGVNLRGKKIGDMSDAELSALADGIKHFEGWKKGTATVIEPAKRLEENHKSEQYQNGMDKLTAPQSSNAIPKHHALLIADSTTHVKSWLAERNIEWSETYNQAAHSVACAMHKAGADRVEHFNAQDGRLHGMQRDGAFMMKTCNLDSKEASFTPVAESLAAMRQIDQERTIAQNNPSQDRNLDQNQSKGGRSV
ncbi:MAG: hypothetical protein ACRCV6_10995 [Formosimonas sp.]